MPLYGTSSQRTASTWGRISRTVDCCSMTGTNRICTPEPVSYTHLDVYKRQGYDHLDEGVEKARMRAREEAILAELGITR